MYFGGNELTAGALMKWPWLIPLAILGLGGLVYDTYKEPAPAPLPAPKAITAAPVVIPAPIPVVAPPVATPEPAPVAPPKVPLPPVKKKPKG